MEQNNKKIYFPSDSHPQKIYSLRPGHGDSNTGKVGSVFKPNTTKGEKKHGKFV